MNLIHPPTRSDGPDFFAPGPPPGPYDDTPEREVALEKLTDAVCCMKTADLIALLPVLVKHVALTNPLGPPKLAFVAAPREVEPTA